MGVFEPRMTITRVEPTRALVATPLGTMAFEARVQGAPLPIVEAHVCDGVLELRRYVHTLADVELLLLPFSPRLPDGMRVDGCVAAVWRIVARGDGAELAFRATWELGARNEDGGPNSGEHLTALTWYAPDVQVSLGTSDEEMLSYAAEDGFLPARLAPELGAEGALFTEYVGERDGLEIALPALLAGETAQVHMVLAWVTGELGQWECSPWYAVDGGPKEITRLVDEALGRRGPS